MNSNDIRAFILVLSYLIIVKKSNIKNKRK